jgi:tetratricopeptide (TPR) repeat protein
MSGSRFSRLWNIVRPPAEGERPVESAKALELRRRQRRLVTITVGVLAALGAVAGVSAYIESAPQRADKEFQEGMKLMRPGKYPDAITRFTRVLNISSQRADAYLERGNAHRSLGETDAALADFQAAADLDSSLVAAHNGIAEIYLDRHDSRHALEELNKSIALDPNIEAYYQRGLILESQGEHQKAIDDYDLAIAQARDAPYMYRARATSKENLGDREGAHADRLIASQIERR